MLFFMTKVKDTGGVGVVAAVAQTRLSEVAEGSHQESRSLRRFEHNRLDTQVFPLDINSFTADWIAAHLCPPKTCGFAKA